MEVQYYELVFPSPITLGSRVIFDEAGDFEELKSSILPVEMRHKRMDVLNEFTYLSFIVARTDPGSRKGGEVAKKQKKNKTKQLLSGYPLLWQEQDSSNRRWYDEDMTFVTQLV